MMAQVNNMTEVTAAVQDHLYFQQCYTVTSFALFLSQTYFMFLVYVLPAYSLVILLFLT